MMFVRTALMGTAIVLAVSGCSRLGNPMEVLTGDRPTPDEFRVKTTRPLIMPVTTALPEPRLGEASRLEYDPNQQARAALGSGPAIARTGVTPGEAALTRAAINSATSGPTGTALAAAETDLTRGKPYDPPTVLELLNLEDGVRAEDVLDPDPEARRLRERGSVIVPVNPAEAGPDAPRDDSGYVSPGEKYLPQFPQGNQRKGS